MSCEYIVSLQKAAARDKLEGLGAINLSNTSITTANITTTATPRTVATIDRSRLLFLSNVSGGEPDNEVERPRAYSLPSRSRNVRAIERQRHLARRNRNIAGRDTENMVPVALLQVREPPPVRQEVAETEEEGQVPVIIGCQVIINWNIVYQRRVVEFLRQDDIISIISNRYDGPITEELR